MGETLVAAGSVASAIATWIKNNGPQLSQNVGFWVTAYNTGEISALEFITAIFAVLSVSDVLLILGGIGIAAGSIWLLYKCIHG